MHFDNKIFIKFYKEKIDFFENPLYHYEIELNFIKVLNIFYLF
jgi:hypothetical protein